MRSGPRPFLRQSVPVFLLFGLWVVTTVRADRATLRQECLDWVGEMVGEGHTGAIELQRPEHEQKREFLEEIFFPVVRQRALVGDGFGYRNIDVGENEVRISGFRPHGAAPGPAYDDVVIRWERGLRSPQIEFRPGERILRLPAEMRIGHQKRYPDSLVKRMLLGHTLHPYSASPRARAERRGLGEPEVLLKQVQEEGAEAVRFAIRSNQNAFLYVAPTGVGKTEIFKSMLKTQVERYQGWRPPKLHILTAHMDVLVSQLEGAARETFTGSKKPVRIITQAEFSGHDMAWLMKEVASSDRPVVLVTTSEAIQAKLRFTGETAKADYDRTVKEMQKHLSTFAIDEAHHAGADGLSTILSDLMEVNKRKPGRMFLYGTTATPFHEQNRGLVDTLFHNRDYWAYLDSPYLFEKRVKRGEPSGHDLDSILFQLEEAMNRGELHPFNVSYLNPDAKYDDNLPAGYFEKSGNRMRLKKDAMPRLLDDDHLGPAFERNKKAFVTVSSIPEANELAASMKARWPGKRVEVLHSDLANPQAVLDKFSRGEIDILVTVKMIDEGYNLPDLSLYVDLTTYTGPRPLLQRIGRITRIAEGKVQPSEVIVFQRITDGGIARVLQRLQQISELSTRELTGGGGGGHTPPRRGTWGRQELERLNFWTRAEENREEAQNDIAALLSYLSTAPGGGPNPFGPAATQPNSATARNHYNLLARALDDYQGGFHAAALHQALFRPLATNAKATDWIEAYRSERVLRRQQLETPVGTREVVVDFVRRHRRVPGRDEDGKDIEKFTTDDEKAIVAAMREHGVVGDRTVLETLLAANFVPTNGHVVGLSVDLSAPTNHDLRSRLADLRRRPEVPPVPAVPRAPRPIGLTADRVERDILNVLLRHVRRFDETASWQTRLDKLNTAWAEYRSLLRRRDALEAVTGRQKELEDVRSQLARLESELFSQPNLELLLQASRVRPGNPVVDVPSRDMRRTMRDFSDQFEISFPQN